MIQVADCGCVARTGGGGIRATYCALHGAAPELLEALRKLANEATSFLALSDIGRHGMTNSRILRDRIEQARDVIRKAEAK